MSIETETNPAEARNTYFAVFKYDVPTEGTVSVSALNIDHAKEIVGSLLDSKKNPVIVDIFDVKNAPKADQEMLMQLAEDHAASMDKKNLN